MELTIPEIQTELVKLNRTIGRFERDIELNPRNYHLLKPQIDAAYEAYGRLSFQFDEKSKNSKPSFMRRLLRQN